MTQIEFFAWYFLWAVVAWVGLGCLSSVGKIIACAYRGAPWTLKDVFGEEFLVFGAAVAGLYCMTSLILLGMMYDKTTDHGCTSIFCQEDENDPGR